MYVGMKGDLSDEEVQLQIDYLRNAGACYISAPARSVETARPRGPLVAAAVAAAAAVVLFVAGGAMIDAARQAAPGRMDRSAIVDVAEDGGVKTSMGRQ